MRCPKCGYISFDHLESCKKCGKNISEASADLNGTVFAVAAPVFLDLDYEEPGEPAEEGDDVFAGEEAPGEEEDILDMSFEDDDVEEEGVEGEGEIVMNLEDDEELNDFGLIDETDDEPTIDLDDFEEVVLEDEISLDLTEDESSDSQGLDLAEDASPVSQDDDGLQLDFGDIDISDLAPPEEGVDEPVAETLAMEEELTLEEEISLDTVMPGEPVAAPDAVSSGSGLEDLQIDDLDLDTPAPLVAGSKSGDKLMPSVKTGTALDDFEIDLGELLSGDK